MRHRSHDKPLGGGCLPPEGVCIQEDLPPGGLHPGGLPLRLGLHPGGLDGGNSLMTTFSQHVHSAPITSSTDSINDRIDFKLQFNRPQISLYDILIQNCN